MASPINSSNDAVSQLLNPSQQKGSPLEELLKAKQKADNPNLPGANTTKPGVTDDFSPSAKGIRAAAAVEKYQASYAYSQTMSMEIKTKEGDVVKVDFQQLYAQYQEYKKEQGAIEGPKGARYFESREAMEATAFEERFGFSVQGDLNEDELKAVFDIFEKVDKLATEFFEGDVQKAFEQAQALEVDFGQIQSFSLDLQKTETMTQAYQQAKAYEGVQQQPVEGQEEAADLSKLPPYLQSWQDIIKEMNEQFEEARETFDNFMAGALEQRAPELGPFSNWLEKVKTFHDELVEAANLNKETLQPSGVEIEPLAPSQDAAPVEKGDKEITDTADN